MNTWEVAKQIKEYLVQLAVDDKLPLNMTELDTEPIRLIIEAGEEPCAFGFNMEDIIAHGKQCGYTNIKEKDAKEILDLLLNGGDVSVGVSWGTVQDCIEEYYKDKK